MLRLDRCGRGGVTGIEGEGTGLALDLCDGRRGRLRRHQLAAQAMRLLRRDEGRLAKRGKDLLNRAAGIAAEVASMVTPAEPVTNEVLAERVRSRMGHLVAHPHGITVEAEQGTITLKGTATHAERRLLRQELRKIPGVKTVRANLAKPGPIYAAALVTGLAAGLAAFSKHAASLSDSIEPKHAA